MSILSDFAAHQRRRGLLASTIERRDRDLRAFRNWLGRCPTTATPTDVEAFLDTRGRGQPIGARTRYAYLSHFHAFYCWAILDERSDTDPTARIPRPKLRRTLPRPIGEEDLAVAIDSAPKMMRAWLCLAAYGGLRCAEIAGLDREDIMEGEGLMRIVGKGRVERMVPIHPKVLDALRAFGMPRSGPIFTRPRGDRFPAGQVSRETSLYLSGLGIEATAHQLRHRFATRTYAVSSDLRVVQELLGHQSPTTTAVYTAFSQARAAEAVEALA